MRTKPILLAKALYEYAREGVEIARKTRTVTIKRIEVDAYEADIATLTVTCTKGTYIRTLAEDIGKVLGCGAHLAGLRRTETAGYTIANTVTVEALEAMTVEQRDAQLLPVDSAVNAFPCVTLDDDASYYLMQGQAVWVAGKIPDSAPKRLIKKSD